MEEASDTSDTSPLNTEEFSDDAAHDRVPESYSAEIVDLCRQALQKIIDAVTSDATITVDENSDHIQFDVHGGNTAILIGKRGQTLEAIQYIIEKIWRFQ